MRSLHACILLLIVLAASPLPAQEATTRSSPAKPREAGKDPVAGAIGGKLFGSAAKEAVTTEIYADQAFFDSEKHIGVFSGRVIVKDPRFNIQADKLTVYLNQGEGGSGLDKAVAEGNVGVVREQPGENGQPPSRSVGRAESAVYTAKDGNVELRGTPRLQSGPNTHIATSPDTVMIVNQNGQLTTRGPSRTELRQEPKSDAPKP